MTNEALIEVLENRRAILKEHIVMDSKCFNDAVLSQFSRGRVAVQEAWLSETEKILEELKR